MHVSRRSQNKIFSTLKTQPSYLHQIGTDLVQYVLLSRLVPLYNNGQPTATILFSLTRENSVHKQQCIIFKKLAMMFSHQEV